MEQNSEQTPLEQFAQLMERHKDSSLTEIPVPQKLIQQVLEDVRGTTELLQTMQGQVMACEKMAALGHIMAGIAHEISTPVASINSNVDLFTRSLAKVKTILGAEDMPEELRGIRQTMQIVNILDGLNQSNQTACDRIMQIVKSLRSFIRSDMGELREIDIHEELENSLTLVYHELKGRIKVVREYGDIPKCTCLPGHLNSVFLNMLMNAAQAIEKEGQITIKTSRAEDNVKIEFTDTGQGVSPENLDKLFEQGFTTKSPDEGTGLGLAICTQIIEQHNGKIEVESEIGKGTTFTVILPIEHEASDE